MPTRPRRPAGAGRKPPGRRWPELHTSVIFGDGAGGAWALGSDVSNQYGVRLDRLAPVLSFGQHRAFDSWTSPSGTTYLATSGKHPLLVHREGTFALAPLGEADADGRIARIRGFGGASPDHDTLVCLLRADEPDEPGSLALRTAGSWTAIGLPAGKAAALEVSAEGDAYIGLAASHQPARPARLLRGRAGRVETLELPPGEDHDGDVAGLHPLSGGRLLVLFRPRQDDRQPVRPWLRQADGTWTRVPCSHPFHPWVYEIPVRSWRGSLYLATDDGVFVHGDDGVIRRDHLFKCSALWVVGQTLLCRGSIDGNWAHQLQRGEGWQPFCVPRPETVFGGKGQLVGLPGGPRTPVVKLRLKAPTPVPAAVAPAAPVTPTFTLPPFSLPGFLDDLTHLPGAVQRTEPLDAVGLLERELGEPLAPDLKAYFTLHGTHRLDCAISQIRFFTETDFPLPSAGAGAAELVSRVYTHAPGVIAALTGTVPLGRDAGGQVYFAEVSAKGSRIHLYGPGVGELKPLARSFTAFTELCHLDRAWERYAELEGVDDEDLIEGNLRPGRLPALAPLRARLRALRDQLHLSGYTGSDVCSDFDETLPRLAGVRFAAGPVSPAVQHFQRGRWLLWLLTGVTTAPEEAAPTGPGVEVFRRTAPAPAVIYWLWHLFLLDRRADLGRLLTPALSHRARLVQGTARLLAELAGTGAVAPELQRLRDLRAVVAAERAARQSGQARPPVVTAEPEEEPLAPEILRLLQPAPEDPPALKELRAQVAARPRALPAWDQLLYGLFQAQHHEEMLAASEIRLALDDGSYYPWLQKGIALMSLQRNAESLEALEQALLRHRANANIWMNIAGLYAEQGDRARALEHLREALHLDPALKAHARTVDEYRELRNDPEFLKLVR